MTPSATIIQEGSVEDVDVQPQPPPVATDPGVAEVSGVGVVGVGVLIWVGTAVGTSVGTSVGADVISSVVSGVSEVPVGCSVMTSVGLSDGVSGVGLTSGGVVTSGHTSSAPSQS